MLSAFPLRSWLRGGGMKVTTLGGRGLDVARGLGDERTDSDGDGGDDDDEEQDDRVVR